VVSAADVEMSSAIFEAMNVEKLWYDVFGDQEVERMGESFKGSLVRGSKNSCII